MTSDIDTDTNTDTRRDATAHRFFFLDWLRIAAFAVLVPYHVGMYYVSWDFHVKSPFAGPALQPWMLLSSPWRMSLLFLVSGAVTALMLRNGAPSGFMRRRSARLLLPLVCGMVLVVPPQSYFEVVQKYGFGGGYLDFLGLYFTHYDGFCRQGECLMLPTWNHLWFLPYLWVYTLMLWSLLALRPTALATLARAVSVPLSGAGLVLLPIGAIFVLRTALHARFPSTHAFFGDWFNHTLYFGAFLCGAAFAHLPGLWDRLAWWRWPGLLAALAAWATVVGLTGRLDPIVRHGLIATLQWGALVAALGFARRHLDADHAARRYLTAAVFPVYVLHQTFIVVFSQWLAPWQWRPALEGPLLVAATFLASFAGYELVRRVGLLRPWFGLQAAASPDRGRADATPSGRRASP